MVTILQPSSICSHLPGIRENQNFTPVPSPMASGYGFPIPMAVVADKSQLKPKTKAPAQGSHPRYIPKRGQVLMRVLRAVFSSALAAVSRRIKRIQPSTAVSTPNKSSLSSSWFHFNSEGMISCQMILVGGQILASCNFFLFCLIAFKCQFCFSSKFATTPSYVVFWSVSRFGD